ncbi:helix-turn-helix transcriptional regulator [Hyphomonas sp. CY54-11-8]|jgi:hypothetical protein|uniref:helix-turn-helix domain-containing protein n=1 Tax=Hyphomonas sp. CY54-11-8 TaxID=1280944 RepID=UPI0004590365|nr:helix-turn-helix transcriptional regulator [Hyphomonas sp. CY54-11-8]KCZ47746.1 hypothetical protein HY17_04520 [Hyphomonas sp. CY54-11-8]
METRGDRLKKARMDAGYTTVRAACDAFGYKYPTYAGHENGSREFDFDEAERYAKNYSVDVMWLMNGKTPAKGERAEVIDIWSRIPERDRQAALNMLRGLAKKG